MSSLDELKDPANESDKRAFAQEEQEECDPPQEEDWSQIMTTDLSAGSFAHHDTRKIQLPNGSSLRIASTPSLSPLDMMDLSWGTHDATGHRIWMGAHLFLHALPTLTPFFTPSNCRCLELGSGTGLAGIAAVKYFGESKIAELVLTDNSKSALELCRLNCEQNQMEGTNIRVEPLEWGSSFGSDDQSMAIPFDVILATDVLYDIAAWEPLLVTSRSSLRVGAHLILSHVPRAALPHGIKQGPELSYHDCLENYLIETARLYRLPLKSIVRPNDLSSFHKGHEMEQVGASILIFENE